MTVTPARRDVALTAALRESELDAARRGHADGARGSHRGEQIGAQMRLRERHFERDLLAHGLDLDSVTVGVRQTHVAVRART